MVHGPILYFAPGRLGHCRARTVVHQISDLNRIKHHHFRSSLARKIINRQTLWPSTSRYWRQCPHVLPALARVPVPCLLPHPPSMPKKAKGEGDELVGFRRFGRAKGSLKMGARAQRRPHVYFAAYSSL